VTDYKNQSARAVSLKGAFTAIQTVDDCLDPQAAALLHQLPQHAEVKRELGPALQRSQSLNGNMWPIRWWARGSAPTRSPPMITLGGFGVTARMHGPAPTMMGDLPDRRPLRQPDLRWRPQRCGPSRPAACSIWRAGSAGRPAWPTQASQWDCIDRRPKPAAELAPTRTQILRTKSGGRRAECTCKSLLESCDYAGRRLSRNRGCTDNPCRK
jgi:hypothetical protein